MCQLSECLAACSLWGGVKSSFNQTVRFGFRQGIPVSLATLIGLTVNQLLVLNLKKEPAVLTVSLSDFVGVITTLLAYLFMNTILECCWENNPSHRHHEVELLQLGYEQL